jgi:hypothetical protein
MALLLYKIEALPHGTFVLFRSTYKCGQIFSATKLNLRTSSVNVHFRAVLKTGTAVEN